MGQLLDHWFGELEEHATKRDMWNKPLGRGMRMWWAWGLSDGSWVEEVGEYAKSHGEREAEQQSKRKLGIK